MDRQLQGSPPGAWILESLRGLGYSAATAAADIVDNSVSAGANKVWLFNEMAPSPTDSYIAFADNGRGMNEENLNEAMRLGSKDPRPDLSDGELGRFGLGMKTASLSQGRRLTVWSKAEGSQPCIRQWDLDRIDDRWLFSEPLLADLEHLAGIQKATGLATLPSGTVVMWSNLDRFLEVSAADQVELSLAAEDVLSAEQVMARKVNGMLEHIGQVFHRFLTPQQEGKPARLRVAKVYDDGSEFPVAPWDPFLETAQHSSPKVQRLQPTKLLKTQRGEATVKPVILPHRSDLRDDTWAMLAPSGSLIGLQGFYVYREDRLISIGGWLGLDRSSDDPTKLARIAVFLGNSADEQWKVSVNKSGVQIPASAVQLMKTIADAARLRSSEVYKGPKKTRVRGKTIVAAPQPIWKRVVVGSGGQHRVTFAINRSHPLVKAAANDSRNVGELLSAVEGGVPYAEIRIAFGKHDADISGVADLAATVSNLERAVEILQKPGESRCQSLVRIADSIEPFSLEDYRPGVSQLAEKWGCRRRNPDG